jgi:hypothetical protein
MQRGIPIGKNYWKVTVCARDGLLLKRHPFFIDNGKPLSSEMCRLLFPPITQHAGPPLPRGEDESLALSV